MHYKVLLAAAVIIGGGLFTSPSNAATVLKPVAPQPAAGWYKLDVSYLQATGGAALELYWIPPGARQRDLIPADAYGHSKP